MRVKARALPRKSQDTEHEDRLEGPPSLERYHAVIRQLREARVREPSS